MSRYMVYLTTTASYGIEVEAASKEEAMDLAEREGAPGLCYQCSVIDLSDFDARLADVEEIQ